MHRIKSRKLNANQEWKILNFEMFENRPKITPYPKHIVRRRELLLLAQNLLANYQFSKVRKHKEVIKKLYQGTMNLYFYMGAKHSII